MFMYTHPHNIEMRMCDMRVCGRNSTTPPLSPCRLHLGKHKAHREWSLVSEFLSCH